MTEKLIELRQRFRGYAPVRTSEEDSEDDEDEIIGVAGNASRTRLAFSVSHRPITGYSDTMQVDPLPPKRSYFCK